MKIIEHDEDAPPPATMDASTIVTLHDRDFDRQIATARRFPRSIPRARSEIVAMATESEGTAQECIYALKRNSNGEDGGTLIMGPSARFAEIVATSFGNARYASRIVDEGPQFITAQAVFHDLENNTYISVEVRRRIVGRNGNRFGVDMIGVTGQAAMSIAMRNAILKGVPRSVWGEAYAKAHALIAGTFETVQARRKSALDAFTKLGVGEEQVLALLEKEKVGEIEPEDIVILRGTLSAIRDGDTTLERIFGSRGRAPAKKADLADRLREGRDRDDKRRQGGSQTSGEAGSTEGDGSRSQADEAGEKEGAASGSSGDAGGGDTAAAGGVAGSGGDASDGGGDADDDGPRDAGAGGGGGASNEGGLTLLDLSPSPQLNEKASTVFGGEIPEGWEQPLILLTNAILVASSLAQLNKAWEKHGVTFDAAPEEVDVMQSELRAARNKDIRAASKTATSKL